MSVPRVSRTRDKGKKTLIKILCCVLYCIDYVNSEVLTPPYYNLAEGRKITATATCGDEGAEMYCKLVGAQVCDFCDLNNPSKTHRPEYAVDGMETWWQSPPLSRGMKYNEVNLTIDLGQEFHVAYVFVRMGNSPRPGLWALEKSSDYGKTYKPWQYFSDSASDCETYFGAESLLPVTKDDSVICNMEYSKIVPLEGGEIPISLLNNRPSAMKYFNSSVLQEWTRATNVRLRLLRTKTLLGHLMSVARQDPTVTRRYFYSIKDISIGGRCMCNGHAELCDIPDTEDPNKLLCRCQHHTCGPQCNYCCPGFQQKAWRQSQNWQKFHCEPCNCFNHSTECDYDPEIDAKHLSLDINNNYEGGGVCKNCQHNTMGTNCNKCKDKFYRPHGKQWNETDVCHPCNCHYHYSTGNCAEGSGQCECRKEYKKPSCDACAYGYFGYPDCQTCICHMNGTEGSYCEPYNGVCPCKTNFAGIYCDQCSDGYFNYPECKECSCDSVGSLASSCDQVSGSCTCKNSYSGRTCEQCAPGYFNYPSCSYCNCDTSGTQASICNENTGECLCKEGFGGARCDQCISGFYSKVVDRERVCVPCNCSTIGSTTTSCDSNGKCTCLFNFAGTRCDQCSPGYYKYPECLPCNCDSLGSIGVTCDSDGQCKCKSNFDTLQCNVCKEGFYNYPTCEECNCDPAGVVQSFAGCGSVPEGELCECKERVQGRICNECKPLFYDLQQYNPLGCAECECYTPGTQGRIGVCEEKSGQCPCKYSVGERSCNVCKDGSYNLTDDNVFGCIDCGCDVGGAVNSICNKQNGQCTCKPRITGLRCDRPLQTHYFPTLYQYQFEAEDAETAQGGQVRAGSLQSVFPDFSWKGYASFGIVQNQIIQPVYIQKASVYRMVMRYVNLSPDPIVATVYITPDNSNEIEQKFDVLLKPTKKPELVTVSGAQGTAASPFVMNSGVWTISIKTTKDLHLDYFVLIPAAYYEATILTNSVENPCTIGNKDLCLHFGFPDISNYDSVMGAGGFTSRNGVRTPIYQYLTNNQQLKELGESEVPLISENQEELLLDLTVTKTGPHIILIEYVTPVPDQNSQPASVNLTARGSSSQEVAKVRLSSCPYTFPCRQVVTDEQNRVQIFNIEDNFVGVNLKSENGSRVAIKSIVVIPYNQWHMDYITPHAICIRRNGTCLATEFPLAPDSKKVEFESITDNPSKARPQNIFDNSTELIYLGADSPHVDISSKVQFPGQFVFVVHYYQPSYPESDMTVLIQNGQIYEAMLPIKHCPSNSGCRSVIKTSDGNIRFSLTENFLLALTADKDKGVWLDYLLIIPADHYSDILLTENKLDQSKEFLSKCGNNHFHINITEAGFCRDSVFSLTSDYNNGALKCDCDYEGSLSFQCNPFGGQCQCKENVIGRKCEACKTGFYGFPDCKPCDCPPTATCEKDTGECKCATHITGEKCDRCVPLTFSFDPSNGCMECNCNPLGVIANQLQCDLQNGSCPCKPSVKGRMCDQCEDGYHSFPYCNLCYCNTNGTLPEICDQETAECYCKSNVYGESCDICKEGTFDLQEENDAGCTKCFCFGKTTKCNSGNLFWSKIKMMHDWFLVNINITQNVSIEQHFNPPQILNATAIGVELTTEESRDSIVYFGAPTAFLGNRLKAYGGKLHFSIYYTTGLFGNAVAQGDVILEGADTWLIHSGIEQPPATILWEKQLELRESEFKTVTGIPATRELLMTVLENLRGVFIRATYWDTSVLTRLQDVSLQHAVPYSKNLTRLDQASSVEECSCPISYKGSSCEECAEGFYRTASGPHGGYCVPCQCNNHATSCDVNTGICYDCQHNTTGDHCEQCMEGYHGNAALGFPHDCLICACPLPQPSNNFATTCEVSSDGDHITCECKEGYFGARCESCDSGFYGRPDRPGDICKPCHCSGNINPEDPESCDTVTGQCLKCMNNTFGDACSLCLPGFYGDAIVAKDCQACICDKLGMDLCDSYTGTCLCRPGVIGDKCDRCEDEHWGFESGAGCKACNCSIASHSRQCDDSTGQCKCMPGVTGKNCDRCAPGFWNYSPEGCVSCGCNSEYSVGFGCNATTGFCECLPGVIGEKCDHCPYRWVLVEEQGCFECDACTHSLLDSTNELQLLIEPVMDDFENKASGYFTARRLEYIKKRRDELNPKVNNLDPMKFDLSSVNNDIDSLENEIKALDRKAEYGASDAERLNKNSGDLLNRTELVLQESINNAIKMRATVSHVWELANSLETADIPRVDSALAEAKQILSDIKDKDLNPLTNNSQSHLNTVLQLQNKVNTFIEPVNSQTKEFEATKNKLNQFNDKIKDANEFNKVAEKKAQTAKILNDKNRENRANTLLDLVNTHMKDAEGDMKNATLHLMNASYIHHEVKDIADSAGRELNELFYVTNEANKRIKERDPQMNELQMLHEKGKDHSVTLDDKSKQLNELLDSLKNNSEIQHAVQGATAYPDIVKEINEAHKLAVESKEAAINVTNLAKGLAERAAKCKSDSSNLHTTALTSLQEVQAGLKPQLDNATNKVDLVKKTNENSSDELNAIEASLNMTAVLKLDSHIKEANKKSQAVNKTASTLKHLIGGELAKSLEKSVNLSRELPKNVDETIKTTNLIKTQLKTVETYAPIIDNLTKVVNKQKDNFEDDKKNAEMNLEKLRKTIAVAKDVANRIKVGVDFKPTSNIQLKPPSNVDELGTSTHVSFYFKTPVENSFLLYLGNQEGTKLRRTKRDDFMALEVVKGYPTLTIDLGDGPVKITNDKYVADDTWYQVIVDRVGKHIEFTIREEVEKGEVKKHIKEQNLKGVHTVFNLDKDQSKLFVGGYPTAYKIQADVEFSSFEGKIEELVIGDTPVGLWNFVEAKDNDNGAHKRDKLLNLNPSTGYNFNGEGYAILDSSQYIFKESCHIQFKFKTFAKEGLLFLVGKGKSFLSIEMRGGRIFFQYRLGGDVLTMGSIDTYNDGLWHTLSVTRYHKEGQLIVDDQLLYKDSENGERVFLEISGQMYFGGYPNKHNYIEVINVGFDGCIDDVVVSGTTVDLSQNIQAFGVTPGCLAKFSKIISFETGGYIKKPNVSSSNDFQLSLKFKTSVKDGLIFYATTTDQSSGISLSLVNGTLILISQKVKMTTESVLYNDDQWHIVTVTHNHATLGITVDDYDYYTSDSAPPPLHFMYGMVFIGGVRPNYVITPQGTATRKPFQGCLADATINGEIVNFANFTEKQGELLGRCTLLKTVPTTHISAPLIPDEDGIETPDIVPPIHRLPPLQTTTPKPKVTTTTVTTSTTQRTPPTQRKEPPKQACAPYDATKGDGSPTEGFRFGARSNSRVEFDKLPARYKEEFDFTVEFNTSSEGGVIFYAADAQHKDFVSVYMQSGKIVYAFNCGSGIARLTSERTYNDSKWHVLAFSRHNQAGKLIVDDELVAEGSSPGSSTSIIMQSPFYYGGLETDSIDIRYNLQNYTTSFNGCLKNLQMSGRLITEIKNKVGVYPCSAKMEEGIYFEGNGGYVKLHRPFKVSKELKISMEIKPRTHSAILLGVHGRVDYLVVELINNTIIAKVNNKRGLYSAQYNVGDQNSLCDGNWHSIQVVKSNNVLTVGLNGRFSQPGIGSDHTANTGSALFIGGHQNRLNKLKGSETHLPFFGCIRNIKIRGSEVKVRNVILPSDAYNDAHVGLCPVD